MNCKVLLFVLLCLSWQKYFAHEYHFAFFEMAYSAEDQQFQGSLSVAAHDLAYITSKKYGKDYSIEQIIKNDSLRLELSSLILNGFTLFQNNQAIYFSQDAFEIMDTGDIIFYFSSETINRQGMLSFSFPLLCSYFPDQQNKVDYIENAKHFTLSFLSNDSIKNFPI